MANAKIDYIKIIDGLQAQFDAVLELVQSPNNGLNEELIAELKTVKAIKVADEQYFVKHNDFDPNNVYIAVKFGSATVNFASSVLAVTLRVTATENKIKPTQLILGEFVTAYNLNHLDTDESMTQVWYTPTVSSNFNPTNKAFRTLFSMAGIVVVGQNTLDLEVLTYVTDTGEEEPVAVMSFDEGYQASANPQPFGNTGGFAKTEINFGTDTITFSTYLLDSQLVADCMHARGMTLVDGSEGRISSKGMNGVFVFKIQYTNNYANNADNLQRFKLISYKIGKKVGDIPSFLVSFSL